MDVVNRIAPEHLELMTDDAEALVPLVRNAGAVFVGPWAPAAVGDYVAGVNHVLPTARTARFASAFRVDTFRKHIHVVRVTPEGLGEVAEHVEALATAEGLPAHGRSVALRRSAAFVKDAIAMSGHRPGRWWRAARDDLRALEGYHSPQLDVSVRLNTNESPYPPPAEFVDRWLAELRTTPLNRYPDRAAHDLRAALGHSLGQPPERLFCANGSNEVLQTLLLSYGGPGRRAAMFEPTYALHAHIARITGTEVVVGERRADFSIDADAARKLVAEQRPTIVFVCSPNNPTGTVEDAGTIEALLEVDRGPGRRRRGVRRVRAAQCARARARRRPPRRGPHVFEGVVDGRAPTRLRGRAAVGRRATRTGRASVSPGGGNADRGEGRARAGHGDERACRAAGRGAGANDRVARRHRPRRPRSRRARTSSCSRCTATATRSGRSSSTRGVLVRDCSGWPRLEDCLRVTVGTPEENDAFLAALRESVREVAA